MCGWIADIRFRQHPASHGSLNQTGLKINIYGNVNSRSIISVLGEISNDKG